MMNEPDETHDSNMEHDSQHEKPAVAKDYWDHFQLGDATAAASGLVDDEEEEGEDRQDQPVEASMDLLPDLVNTNQHVKLNKHDLKWNKHIEELQAFKDLHGHINVPRTDEYKKIYRFLDNQGQNYRLLIEGKKSTLTVQRIKDLDALGMKWKVEPEQIILGRSPQNPEAYQAIELKTKQNQTWDSYFEQLKQYHAQSGHFRVPYKIQKTKRGDSDPYTNDDVLKLGNWVRRQRSKYASDTLQVDRVEKLNSIGFKFKLGKQSKEEKVELQLGLLDALRKRRELSAAQVADLNYLYDEWKRRAEGNINESVYANAAPGSLSSNRHDLKWAANFEKLKEFKLKHGHMRIPRGEEDKEIKALAKWVDVQRQNYAKRKRGEKVALDDSRISRLEDIGFVWSVRQELPSRPTKRAKPSTDLPAVAIPSTVDFSKVFTSGKNEYQEGIGHVYQHKWDCKFGEFKRYKAETGLPRVTAKVKQMYPKWLPQLRELSKWIDNQRLFFRNGVSGKKNSLSDERIRLLVQAGFDFRKMKGKPVHYKAWQDKFEELKEFKEKHGHTRVKALDSSDPKLFKLSKWVQNQRSHYSKYLKGEKSSIDEERAELLESIGFEWRLKPGKAPKPAVSEGKLDSKNEPSIDGGADKLPPLDASTTANQLPSNTPQVALEKNTESGQQPSDGTSLGDEATTDKSIQLVQV